MKFYHNNDGKILLITPDFHGYGQALAQKYRELGYTVTHIFDCPNLKIFKKAIKYYSIRTKLKFILSFIEWINSEIILSRVKHISFNYIIIIKGNHLSKRFLLRLRAIQSKAKIVNYQWDSWKAYSFTLRKDYTKNRHYFDKLYSFDRTDCENHEYLNYLPLFFLDDYNNKNLSNEENHYDLFFIGSSHSSRINIILNLYRNTNYNNSNCCFIFLGRHSGQNNYGNCFKFINKELGHKDVVELINRSKVVLDIPSDLQDGITMRTLEALGAGKKLATTNKMIKKEPFYNENNIYVFDPDNPKIPVEFINSPFIKTDMSAYSLTAFARNLIK